MNDRDGQKVGAGNRDPAPAWVMTVYGTAAPALGFFMAFALAMVVLGAEPIGVLWPLIAFLAIVAVSTAGWLTHAQVGSGAKLSLKIFSLFGALVMVAIPLAADGPNYRVAIAAVVVVVAMLIQRRLPAGAP